MKNRTVAWITECPDRRGWMARILLASATAESGCWVWSNSLDRSGYGRFRAKVQGRRCAFSAHRAAYLAFRGSIAYPLVPDHLCRNRACVNPWHMELVTAAENTQRGHAGVGNLGGHWSPEKVVGCRSHGLADGYRHLQPNGYERWVCRTCAAVRRARWNLVHT